MTLLGNWSSPMPYQVDVSLDSDGDGLPDAWELAHQMNALDATGTNGAAGDFDGDEFSNWSEYIADTDPRDASSFLQVTGIQLVPGGVQVSWQGGVLAIQVLQQRLGLEAGFDWVDVHSNFPPTRLSNSWTISYDTNTSSLFRVRAQRP